MHLVSDFLLVDNVYILSNTTTFTLHTDKMTGLVDLYQKKKIGVNTICLNFTD